MNWNEKLKLITASVVLTTAVSACTGQNSGANTSRTSENASLSAIEVIHKRTSIRKYTDQKLTKDQLETLVKAGMAAPTAVNAQPWHFIIVDAPEILQAIGDSLRTSSMVKSAPAAILVCGDLSKTKEGWLQQYWIQDCSAASQNILLAATGMGLGAVWTSVYPAEDRIKFISKLLNLPGHIIPLNVIPVGYSAEEKEPMNKWKPENVSWNRM